MAVVLITSLLKFSPSLSLLTVTVFNISWDIELMKRSDKKLPLLSELLECSSSIMVTTTSLVVSGVIFVPFPSVFPSFGLFVLKTSRQCGI